MKKKSSTVLSLLGILMYVTMVPSSVEGMWGGRSQRQTTQNRTSFDLRFGSSRQPSQNLSGLPFQGFASFVEEWNNRPNFDIGRAFHNAVQRNDMEKIAAIAAKAEAEGKNLAEEIINFYRDEPALLTFLHQCRNPQIVQLIGQYGLQVLTNYAIQTGETPLMCVQDGAVAQALIDNGASIEYTDRYGETPLFRVKTGEVAEVLIINGAPVNQVNKMGETPLFYAKKVDVAQALINNGADIHHRNLFRETPLMRTSSPQIAQLLIDQGASADDLFNNGLIKKDIKQQILIANEVEFYD